MNTLGTVSCALPITAWRLFVFRSIEARYGLALLVVVAAAGLFDTIRLSCEVDAIAVFDRPAGPIDRLR